MEDEAGTIQGICAQICHAVLECLAHPGQHGGCEGFEDHLI